MAKATIFYLENCPYCRKAIQALGELQQESEACRAAEVEWIEESRQGALAEQYDYYYVPSVFVGKDKLYECSPAHSYEDIKENLRAALEKAAAV